MAIITVSAADMCEITTFGNTTWVYFLSAIMFKQLLCRIKKRKRNYLFQLSVQAQQAKYTRANASTLIGTVERVPANCEYPAKLV